MAAKAWRKYEQLRPDELADIIKVSPVAYWPLGLLEHHGWHLPVGFDGIKAERICERMAGRTGGVILPVMWWGGLGGHGDFMWTLYQSEDNAREIIRNSTQHLITYGFRAIVILMGHYPWEQIAGHMLVGIQREHPKTLILWGTEASIGRPEILLPGDHAAREETSYGLALLPELIDMEAMRPGHDDSAWPNGRGVATDQHYPGVNYDTNDPLFAQMGVDARTGSSQRGEQALERLVNSVSGKVNGFIGS